MLSDPAFLAVALPAVFLVGMAKGGFGGPLVLLGVPLMSLAIPPVQAAGIMLPILVAMDMVGIWAYRRSFDRPSLKLMLPAAMVGVLVGWATAAYVTDAHVKLLVGAIALAFTLDYWLRDKSGLPPHRPGRLSGTFWGAMSGFTSFVSHAGGPPWNMYMLPQRLESQIFAGTAVMFFTAVNLSKIVPYAMLGQLAPSNLKISAALLPLGMAATLVGVWLVRRVPQQRFYRLTYACVFLVALKLIYDGARSLLAG